MSSKPKLAHQRRAAMAQRRRRRLGLSAPAVNRNAEAKIVQAPLTRTGRKVGLSGRTTEGPSIGDSRAQVFPTTSSPAFFPGA